jgi:hypothetical protein
VFLSYAAADRASAEHIRAGLQAHGLSVFDAFHDVAAGENIARRVAKALDDSDAMVTLVSPASTESPWVTREVEFALTSPQFQRRLVPVVVKPTKKSPWILEKLGAIHATGDWNATLARIVKALNQSPQTVEA